MEGEGSEGAGGREGKAGGRDGERKKKFTFLAQTLRRV